MNQFTWHWYLKIRFLEYYKLKLLHLETNIDMILWYFISYLTRIIKCYVMLVKHEICNGCFKFYSWIIISLKWECNFVIISCCKGPKFQLVPSIPPYNPLDKSGKMKPGEKTKKYPYLKEETITTKGKSP